RQYWTEFVSSISYLVSREDNRSQEPERNSDG
ncbi:unnamed protein product, partial [marine sediment metagenome]